MIEKRGGMKLSQKDVFKHNWGIKGSRPRHRFISCFTLSSFFDFYIDHKVSFIGEVGLSGELEVVE